MAGTFDNEIKQAMAPGDKQPSPKQPAKSSVAEKPNAPAASKMPPAPHAAPHAMPPMQGATSDPVAHAAGIAHAILMHGGR